MTFFIFFQKEIEMELYKFLNVKQTIYEFPKQIAQPVSIVYTISLHG